MGWLLETGMVPHTTKKMIKVHELEDSWEWGLFWRGGSCNAKYLCCCCRFLASSAWKRSGCDQRCKQSMGDGIAIYRINFPSNPIQSNPLQFIFHLIAFPQLNPKLAQTRFENLNWDVVQDQIVKTVDSTGRMMNLSEQRAFIQIETL